MSARCPSSPRVCVVLLNPFKDCDGLCTLSIPYFFFFFFIIQLVMMKISDNKDTCKVVIKLENDCIL